MDAPAKQAFNKSKVNATRRRMLRTGPGAQSVELELISMPETEPKPKPDMQDYWHIPRASLVSSSSSAISSAISSASSSKSSNKSNSNPPTLAQRSTVSTNSNATTSAAVTAAAAAAVLAAAKRGSRSSQGSSSDGNNSTRSAASGSMLLTAANLERFAEIHKKQERQNKMMLTEQQLPSVHGNSSSSANYNANLTLANNNNDENNKDAVIAIDADPNLQYIRTKDLDTVSIASSMHFTMVNGEPGGAKKPKRGLCDRGRQVTVLIVSMSTIFLLLIMGMVYALEMRARDMPKS